MTVCAPHACKKLWRPEEGVGPPGTRVPGCCELSHECQEPNPHLLQESGILVTAEHSWAKILAFNKRRNGCHLCDE